MISLPALLIGFLISTLIGAAFHLLSGGSAGRLLLYIFLAWAGFWGGHIVGSLLGLTLLSLGALRLGAALTGSLFLLGIGHWLSQMDNAKR